MQSLKGEACGVSVELRGGGAWRRVGGKWGQHAFNPSLRKVGSAPSDCQRHPLHGGTCRILAFYPQSNWFTVLLSVG